MQCHGKHLCGGVTVEFLVIIKKLLGCVHNTLLWLRKRSIELETYEIFNKGIGYLTNKLMHLDL